MKDKEEKERQQGESQKKSGKRTLKFPASQFSKDQRKDAEKGLNKLNDTATQSDK
jgi:hypothetical protein